MEHVVFYPSSDGSPAFRRLPSLDDAVRFVEHLRNVEDVSDFSVHALAEVPLSFRAYYKVDVPGQAASAADAAPVTAVVAEPPAAEPTAGEPTAAEVVEAPVAAAVSGGVEATDAGRKSLGFFAR